MADNKTRVLYSGQDGFAILVTETGPYPDTSDAEVFRVTDEEVEDACRVWYDSTLSPGQYTWDKLVQKADWRLEAWRHQIRAVLSYLAAKRAIQKEDERD